MTDITRAWPVNGTFSPAQKDLYEMILGVQRTCVSTCREDAKVSLDDLHTLAEYKLRDGLKELGFDVSNKVSTHAASTSLLLIALGNGNSLPTSCWPLRWISCP